MAQTWWAMSGIQPGVNEANSVHLDFFNGHDSVQIVSVFAIIPVMGLVADVFGAGTEWEIWKTTSVGIDGTAFTNNSTTGAPTIVTQDTANNALDANITARNFPTSGATAAIYYGTYFLNSEETNTATQQTSSQLGANWIHGELLNSAGGQFLTSRAGEGFKIIKKNATEQINIGWMIGFTVA